MAEALPAPKAQEAPTKAPKQPKRLSIERRAKRQPSKRLGEPGKPIPLPIKSAILEAAKADILAGKTIDQIAAEHGIAHLTLSLWLHGLGDEYKELRQAWVDGMLDESGRMLKEAPDALSLARARELQRRAQWYAERRDRDRYGDRMLQVTVNTVNVDAGLVGRVTDLIDAEIVEQRSNTLDSSSDTSDT